MTDDEGPETGAETDPAPETSDGDTEASETNGTAETEPAAETVDDPAADGESAGNDGAKTAEVVDESADVQAGPPIGEDLTDRIAEHDEELASEVALVVEKALELKKRVDEQAEELEEKAERIEQLESALKKSKADFQNYKKRQDREKERIRERATEDLVERLLDVRDNLTRAAEQDHDDVASIQEGVKMTLKEFDRVLDAENVEEIKPEPGEDVDPQRHEVMMRVESDQPADTIADVYSPGYEMADKVLKTAQVTVSEGSSDDAEATEEADDVTDAPGDGTDGDGGTEDEAETDDATSDGADEADDGVEEDGEPGEEDVTDDDAEEGASGEEESVQAKPAPAAEPVEPTDDDVIAAEPVEVDGSESDGEPGASDGDDGSSADDSDASDGDADGSDGEETGEFDFDEAGDDASDSGDDDADATADVDATDEGADGADDADEDVDDA